MRFTPYFVFWGVLTAAIAFFAPSRPGRQTKAAYPIDSRPCGGPPNYCANSTRNIVPETPMARPPVNTPFRDPDFGSRMVRVTDADTLANTPRWGNALVGISFHTASAGEVNEWSKLDPSIGEHGGYRFWVRGANGGGTLAFELDSVTMHVAMIKGKHGMPTLPLGVEFSYVNPDILYGMRGPKIFQYSFKTGKIQPIYDFAKCPGLPEPVRPGEHAGVLTISGDDTKFADILGGSEQDGTKEAFFYNRTTGACYWYNTRFGTTGGTNMPATPVANGVGQLAPPSAPKITPYPGSGSLPPDDYYVEITALSRLDSHNGETRPSPEVGPVHLASAGSLTVSFPALPNPDKLWLPPHNSGCWSNAPRNGRACTPFNVYVGTSRGGEMLQTVKGPVGGRSYSQSVPLNAPSRRPPQVGTAGYTIHDARMSKSGSVVRVEEAFRGHEYFWTPGTTTVTPCLTWPNTPAAAGYCGGHAALGYAHMVNSVGYRDDMQIVIRPFSNLRDIRLLVDPLATPAEWTQDKHWSWSDANPSDTMPVCGALYTDAAVKRGDGTRNILTNPVLQIHRAWDGEIVCIATTGPSKVWRFAHARGTGSANASAPVNSDFWAQPIGNVSQDGKFYLFGTNWNWGLGSERGKPGCPVSGVCRTDVFVVELH